ncbi:MAG: hypothetical protein WD035_02255 [Balneolaceae bacterium]
MDRIIREVTGKLTGQLPSKKEFFYPHELREFNIPGFIVDRIEIELKRKVGESVVRSESEWVDFSSPDSIRAREDFTEALLNNARLPKLFVGGVFETAVEESLAILIQPRKKIPAILYGPGQSKSVDQLEKATANIVVFKHLAIAPVRYAYKKGLKELSLEQCRTVISRVDDKLVGSYNALNWTQLLEPLFRLLEDQLDTDLLRLFFEDKQRPRIARQFDLMDGPLTRSQFIEVLSSPDMLDLDQEEKAQATLFDRSHQISDTGHRASQEEESVKKKKEKPSSQTDTSDPSESQKGITDESDEEGEEDSESFNRMFSQFEQSPAEESEEGPAEPSVDYDIEVGGNPNTGEDETELSLHHRFRLDTDAEEEEPDEEVEEEHEDSFNTLFTGEDEELKREAGRVDEASAGGTVDPDSGSHFDEINREMIETGTESDGQPQPQQEKALENEKKKGEEENRQEEITEHEDEEINDSDESPAFWQNFVPEEEQGSPYGSEEKEMEEQEPIIDLAGEEQEKRDAKIRSLTEWMSGDEERFIEEIFTGSSEAYEETLAVLATFDDWKSATRYIEKEVFERNHIDMYEEAPVDFTDRLHAFFNEIGSPKSTSRSKSNS